MNSNHDNGVIEKYEDMESYIFARCEEAGFGDLSEKYGKKFCPSALFDESGIMDFIDDYDQQTVCQQLGEELAYKDAPKGLSEDELGDFLEKRYDVYMKEFEENGLDNVYLRQKEQ